MSEFLTYKHLGDYSLDTKAAETLRLKYDSDNRVISGYGAVYEVIDRHSEYFAKGAFDDFVSRREFHTYRERLRFCVDHDINMPISRITELTSDDIGLHFITEVKKEVLNIPYVMNALILIETGVRDEVSVAALMKDANIAWDEGRKALRINKSAAKEISTVTLAANPLALIEAVKTKAATDAGAAELYRKLETLSQKNVTDELGRAAERSAAALKNWIETQNKNLERLNNG